MATPIPVLLDVDTGYDDALAILLALRAPALDVRGITCVAGNQRLPQVVTNTLTLLDALDDDTPVAAGMDRPLLEPMRPPMALHGRDGMADLGLPDPVRKPVSLHAVELMRRALEESTQPVTLVCLAPLTNIAVFLRLHPYLHSQIDRILIMGGTLHAHGNTSPTAEFNIRHDPEAAAMVLESGLPVRLYPLDVFRAVSFSRDEAAAFVASDAPAAHLAGRILTFACDFFGRESALVGDAGTVATLLDPQACTVEEYPVTVELAGAATRGMTVLDRRNAGQRDRSNDWWATSPAVVEAITAVDAERYRQLTRNTWAEHNA